MKIIPRLDSFAGKTIAISAALGGVILLVSLPCFLSKSYKSSYKSEADFQSKALYAVGTVTKNETQTYLTYSYSSGYPSVTGSTTINTSTVKFKANRNLQKISSNPYTVLFAKSGLSDNRVESIEFTTTKACSISDSNSCVNKKVPVLYDPASSAKAAIDYSATSEYTIVNLLWLLIVWLMSASFVFVGESKTPKDNMS
jgi:hypothetical protein